MGRLIYNLITKAYNFPSYMQTTVKHYGPFHTETLLSHGLLSAIEQLIRGEGKAAWLARSLLLPPWTHQTPKS